MADAVLQNLQSSVRSKRADVKKEEISTCKKEISLAFNISSL